MLQSDVERRALEFGPRRLTRIVRRRVADFVRSRAATWVDAQNSYEFRYTLSHVLRGRCATRVKSLADFARGSHRSKRMPTLN